MQKCLALFLAFFTGLWNCMYAFFNNMVNDYMFRVDTAVLGETLPNVKSNLNRFGGRFPENPVINEEYNPYEFVDYIQLMECSGGSAGRANDLDRDQASANAIAFKEAAEKEMSCKVALYTNLYWENTYFDMETLNQFEIWYADYESTPQTSYQFTWWQYTEEGSVPGVKGKMDLNLWIKRID